MTVATVHNLFGFHVVLGISEVRIHLRLEHLLHGAGEQILDHRLHILQVLQVTILNVLANLLLRNQFHFS